MVPRVVAVITPVVRLCVFGRPCAWLSSRAAAHGRGCMGTWLQPHRPASAAILTTPHPRHRSPAAPRAPPSAGWRWCWCWRCPARHHLAKGGSDAGKSGQSITAVHYSPRHSWTADPVTLHGHPPSPPSSPSPLTQKFGEPKVADLDSVLLHHEHVGRAQVAVQVVLAVKVAHACVCGRA